MPAIHFNVHNKCADITMRMEIIQIKAENSTNVKYVSFYIMDDTVG